MFGHLNFSSYKLKYRLLTLHIMLFTQQNSSLKGKHSVNSRAQKEMSLISHFNIMKISLLFHADFAK